MSIPSSTYRLQIRQGFPLDAAAALTDYLSDLGVGAAYASPLLQSTHGSDHGYDTTDVTRIDPDRGGEPGLDHLRRRTTDAGLGLVVDIVPNHLGISAPAENPAWWDVLRLGQESPYADWFDIDWTRGRILLPILGDDDTLTLTDEELHYFDHRFPLAPDSRGAGDDSPEDVHARQHYELVHWSRGNTELNYRRFFAVTTLAGVRVEDRAVFDATHALIARWAHAAPDPAQHLRPVDGLRVDHPDGLVDPAGYLEWLRALAPDAWITVEKILEPGEDLPPEWPVDGTTGYDAMREVNGVFLDPDAEPVVDDLYRRLTGDDLPIAEHIEQGKRMVITELLPAEVARMAALVPEIAEAGAAIGEIAVAFAVYRSYLPEGAADLDAAIAQARRRRPDLAAALDALDPVLHDPTTEVARRMQQLSGATMAKGVEDTAFYRYARFIGLNEVGGGPGDFGIPVDDFHALQRRRQERQPRSMTSLSTHDTKRGEDVRARLAVLAEMPVEWTRFAEQALAASTVPNRAFGYFLAQTLIGAGPIERERMHAYAEKAMREANDGTTYTAPDEAYESAVHQLVDTAYEDVELRGAWDALDAELTPYGWSNSLGQKLVQLTMPGIPDVYQGTELWDDSLVDPDNRRPVGWALRRRLLAELETGTPPPVDASGRAKLWLVRQTLRLRSERPDLFAGYVAIEAGGAAARHLIAFDRGGAVTVASRLPRTLHQAGGWRDTELTLPAGDHHDTLTGRSFSGTVALSELLASYPVALLVRS